MKELESGAHKFNQLILGVTVSSGSADIDELLVEETMQEVARGWTDGPYELLQLEPGATISRRFPLPQQDKTRLIEDFSVNGVYDSCVIHHKLDLRMIDTFGALVKKLFQDMSSAGLECGLVVKTCDLKSAYRQVPIKLDHLKFAYFSVFNRRKGRAEVYRMLTPPFGATHSVYSFL